MKTSAKSTFIALCLLGTALTVSAQFKVDSQGRAHLKHNGNESHAILNIGGDSFTGMYPEDEDSMAIQVVKSWNQNGACVGIWSNTARTGNTAGDVIGLYADAYGAKSGYHNFGVGGAIIYPQPGAAVIGSSEGTTNVSFNGSYAGFFYGDAYVDCSLSVLGGIYNYSDMKLKDNVVTLGGNGNETSVLDALQSLDVMEYNLRSPMTKDGGEEGKVISGRMRESQDRRHYGLSAQELQTVFPLLVQESQEGYLMVNYVELVPLLLRSIQELKAEIDGLKGNDSGVGADPVSARSSASAHQTTAIGGVPATTRAVLYQNTPNPFTAQTEIRFSLPDDAPQAYIYIFDMTGKMQKQIPVDASQQSVTINGYELQAGIYLYSLVVGGQEIDTKRMILSK